MRKLLFLTFILAFAAFIQADGARAADKLTVKINNQDLGGNIADKLIVETDNLTVGNNLAYKIAVEVDGRNFNCRGRSSKKQHGEKGKCPHTRPDFIQKI